MPQNYVTPQPATLPEGECRLWVSPQTILNEICKYMRVPLPANVGGVVYSATKPVYDPTNPMAWGKLDELGRLIRFYFFAQGMWLARHPDDPGKGCFITVPVNTVDLTIDSVLRTFCDFEGGALAQPTEYAGAFYEIIYAGRFLVGVGKTPDFTYTDSEGNSQTIAGETIGLGDTGGEQLHLLLNTEGAITGHKHVFGNFSIPTNDDARLLFESKTTIPSTNSMEVHGNTDNPLVTPITEGDLTTAAPVGPPVVPHNNMPQYGAVYWATRTARRWYVEV